MRLSQNFTLAEFTKSNQAIKLRIDNTNPTPAAIECMKELCAHVLEPLRAAFDKPIRISSGYRNMQLNHAMGGAEKSQHIYGQAADIEIPGISNDLVWQYIVDQLPYDQVIAEHLSSKDGAAGWIHVSYVPNGRREALSCAHGDYLPGLVYED